MERERGRDKEVAWLSTTKLLLYVCETAAGIRMGWRDHRGLLTPRRHYVMVTSLGLCLQFSVVTATPPSDGERIFVLVVS